MIRRNTLLGALMAAACLFAAACTSTKPDADGATYFLGEMRVKEDYTVTQAYDATIAALGDLEMPVSSKQKTELDGQIHSQTSDKKEIIITLKRLTDTSTQIGIRVGPIGEEKEKAKAILEKIRANARK